MYFSELNRRTAFQRRYHVARALIEIIAGIGLLFAPLFIGRVAVQLGGIFLILTGALIGLPIVLNQVTPHLKPMMLARSVGGIIAGVLLLVLGESVLIVIQIAFGALFMLRGLVGIYTVVEADQGVRWRRSFLLLSLLSLIVGIGVLLGVRVAGIFALYMTALWLIVDGITDLQDVVLLTDAKREHDVYLQSILAQVPHTHAHDRAADAPQRPDIQPLTREKTRWLEIDPSQFKRPLVIAPHPDDLEGFAGGLVYAMDAPVTSVIMAGGDKGVWTPEFAAMHKHEYIQVRLEEAEEAAQILGVQDIIYMGYYDRGVTCTQKSIDQVVAVLEQVQPDLVISFEYHKRLTPYAHPDHMATADIVRRAIAQYPQRDQVTYLVTATFAPTQFIDVTTIRRIKLEALACHSTQAGLNQIIFPFFERLMTQLWGTVTGTDFAEGYRAVSIPKMIERLPPLQS
jgi:LmbE family N-acetylglucosaminyl deacetylase/uncharacterized membrane protein HdeD (DUF308 family)